MSSDLTPLHIFLLMLFTLDIPLSDLHYKTKSTTDNYMTFIYPFRQTFLLRYMDLNPVPPINLNFSKLDSSRILSNFKFILLRYLLQANRIIPVLEMVALWVVLQFNNKLKCLYFREASFRRAFNEFDTDGSGYIDNTELMVIISYLLRFFAIRNSTRFGRFEVLFLER